MTGTRTIVLLGRTQAVIDDVVAALHRPGLDLSGGTDVDHLRRALDERVVDQVVIGGGLELDTRLAAVREVLRRGARTTVHLNAPSGPASFLPFVAAIVDGFAPAGGPVGALPG